MNRLILATAFAASLAFALPTAAEAKTNVQIFFGTPHYDYQVGPDYRFRDGYGWYRPAYRGRLSCNQAKRQVLNRGFRRVSTIECRGSTYTFRAIRRGDPVRVYVNARTGAVWRS
jgi:hypothetical protein